MALIKVKVTRMYFDGERRHREGEVLHLEEKQLIANCHERTDGKKIKGSKDEPEKKAAPATSGKKPLPGQGPLVKQQTTKEPEEVKEGSDSKDPSDEETPI